jgi:DNA-binding phage protein
MRALALAPDSKVDIIEIAHQMNLAGLPKIFIASAVDTAFEFEGVYDLFKLWAEESDAQEKEEIIADIQEMIDDCSQKDLVETSYIRFDDLEAIAKDIRTFKDNLRILVDERSTLSELAKLTGIPQPSLSRFFSSSTMPRRTTLNKIARALKLSQVEIVTPWAR